MLKIFCIKDQKDIYIYIFNFFVRYTIFIIILQEKIISHILKGINQFKFNNLLMFSKINLYGTKIQLIVSNQKVKH